MAIPFDPRVAELLGHDEHLPPVDPRRFLREALVQRFQQPPAWEPDIAVETWYRAPDPVPASVLVPIVMREQPSVLLTQRTSHLKKHGGQISFPGGRSEPSDPDAIFTALREAQEEVGLAPERVDVLGTLPTYTTGTGFIVTPVVGLIIPDLGEAERLALTPDPSEVQDIFEVPLHFLMNPRFHQRRAFDVSEAKLEFFAMPWTAPAAVQNEASTEAASKEYFIWGATAAMLRNLYRFLSA
jgi:8-oxo-dGTP pyrophosphatase MutT (NUDIX family)